MTKWLPTAMSVRKFFTRRLSLAVGLTLFLGLVGCGSSGVSIVGTWEVQKPAPEATLIANADQSFTIKSRTGETSNGRWESHGHKVTLFRDVRNGGDDAFGLGGDGGSEYSVSADGTTLTSTSAASQKLVMKLKK